jgi:hypothetical protein
LEKDSSTCDSKFASQLHSSEIGNEDQQGGDLREKIVGISWAIRVFEERKGRRRLDKNVKTI